MERVRWDANTEEAVRQAWMRARPGLRISATHHALLELVRQTLSRDIRSTFQRTGANNPARVLKKKQEQRDEDEAAGGTPEAARTLAGRGSLPDGGQPPPGAPAGRGAPAGPPSKGPKAHRDDFVYKVLLDGVLFSYVLKDGDVVVVGAEAWKGGLDEDEDLPIVGLGQR